MKLQILGFAIVAAIATGGVDYTMQSKRLGQPLGQIGLAAYVGTISNRYETANAASALKSRQKQAAKIHLPEAPDGWVRRNWEDGDNALLEPPARDLKTLEKQAAHARELSLMMAGMLAEEIKGGPRLRRTEIWVYERGDEIIALRAKYTKPDAKPSFSSMVQGVADANIRGVVEARGYAVIAGVAYGEIRPVQGDAALAKYRGFSASMGENVLISVRAVASDDAIRSMMAAIDYDGLNGMLDPPLENVGSQASVVEPSQQAVLAGQMLEQKRDMLRDKGLIAVVEPEVVEEVVVEEMVSEEEAAEPKTIEVGFNAVAVMPGLKCERSNESQICVTAADE